VGKGVDRKESWDITRTGASSRREKMIHELGKWVRDDGNKGIALESFLIRLG